MKDEFMKLIREHGYRFQVDLARALSNNSEHYAGKEESVRILLNQALKGDKAFPIEMREDILKLTKEDERMKDLFDTMEKARNSKKRVYGNTNYNPYFEGLFEEYSSNLRKSFTNASDCEKIEIISTLERLVSS